MYDEMKDKYYFFEFEWLVQTHALPRRHKTEQLVQIFEQTIRFRPNVNMEPASIE